MPSSNSRRPRISFRTWRPASAPRPAGLMVPRNAGSSAEVSRATSEIDLPPVEVHVPAVVDRLAADGEERPGGAQPRAVAIGARVLDHHLVEPRFHFRVRLAALPVAPVVAFDAPRDARPADLAPFLLLAPNLRVWRGDHPHLLVDAVQNRVPRLLAQLVPR